MFENPTVRKIAQIALLLLLEALFFGLELWTGEAVSLQSLFVIPIIVSGLFLGNAGIIFFSVISAIIRVEAYRRSQVNEPEFDYVTSLIFTLFSYTLIASTVIFGRTYQQRYEANYQIAVGRRIANIQPDAKRPRDDA
jgi:hypothetical protein